MKKTPWADRLNPIAFVAALILLAVAVLAIGGIVLMFVLSELAALVWGLKGLP